MKTDKKPAKPKKAVAKTTIEPIKPSGLGESVGEKAGSETVAQKSGAVGNKRPPVEHQFKPGNNANPGGKPVGARNRLQGDFMRELAEDFSVNGKAAIVQCRTDTPAVYIKVIASLMPKELEIKRPLEDLSEDELIASVDALRSYLGSQGAGAGVSTETQRKQTH